ncbi:MAG: sulfur carrier protein ThiS [Vicinamibacterales bacterium]
MNIVLNGETYKTDGPLTIGRLLVHLDIDRRRVAVEQNMNVIKKPNYDSTIVNNGDAIEVVNFIGGG